MQLDINNPNPHRLRPVCAYCGAYADIGPEFLPPSAATVAEWHANATCVEAVEPIRGAW